MDIKEAIRKLNEPGRKSVENAEGETCTTPDQKLNSLPEEYKSLFNFIFVREKILQEFPFPDPKIRQLQETLFLLRQKKQAAVKEQEYPLANRLRQEERELYGKVYKILFPSGVSFTRLDEITIGVNPFHPGLSQPASTFRRPSG